MTPAAILERIYSEGHNFIQLGLNPGVKSHLAYSRSLPLSHHVNLKLTYTYSIPLQYRN